ncbi:unnamed protein product [Boreogadus saida]
MCCSRGNGSNRTGNIIITTGGVFGCGPPVQQWPNPVTYQDNANPEPPQSPLGPRGHRGPEKVPAPRNNRGDCVRSASARAEAEGAP